MPCRYVITSKGVVGSPQFTMQSSPEHQPAIAVGMFRFVPPAGARRLSSCRPRRRAWYREHP
ncbi:DUF2092 domain-containing protein [Candidatus Skiveiella danica]|uniref:DUF2092 domain-containing protein n=1 Tax=Candidatus Skiveiella danica TaxID=3386177 RepID=UPI0039B88BC7